MSKEHNGILTNIKFYYLDSKKSFLYFWLIIIGVELLFMTFLDVSIFVSDSSGSVSNVRIMEASYSASMIFMIFVGLLTMLEGFPVAIGLGSTRRDYFIGSLIGYVGTAGAMLLIQRLVGEITTRVAQLLQMDFVAGRQPGGPAGIVEQFLGYLLITAIFHLVGVGIYRLGKKFWLYVGIFALIGNFGLPLLGFALPDNMALALIDVARSLLRMVAENRLIIMGAAVIVLFGLSWLPLRRTEVR